MITSTYIPVNQAYGTFADGGTYTFEAYRRRNDPMVPPTRRSDLVLIWRGVVPRLSAFYGHYRRIAIGLSELNPGYVGWNQAMMTEVLFMRRPRIPRL